MGYSVMVDAKEPWCCETPCEHRDCAAIRARVNAPCRICEQPVAPGQNYYDGSEGGKTVLVHVVCLYDEVVVKGAELGEGVELDDVTKRVVELLARLPPGERRDFLQVGVRGKEISKIVMTAMPDELEALVKDDILPGSHAWWLVMCSLAARGAGRRLDVLAERGRDLKGEASYGNVTERHNHHPRGRGAEILGRA